MKKIVFFAILALGLIPSYSQKILMSWGQQNIENYTKEMYDTAQKLSSSELLTKNLNDKSWSSVFVTLNASVNNYSKDTAYLRSLAGQIVNETETKLEGTSRLIIWDRIISGDIIFEGKGLVIENDLFKTAGRANQLLQSLTEKNFGYVTLKTTKKQLEELKSKWLAFLDNKPVEEFKAIQYPKAKISEISSLAAVEAFIISLQPNSTKESITKSCLKKLYNLEELPKEKDSPANYCNPDTYTFSYLRMLFGDKVSDEYKDASAWKSFWEQNKTRLLWNTETGLYDIKN